MGISECGKLLFAFLKSKKYVSRLNSESEIDKKSFKTYCCSATSKYILLGIPPFVCSRNSLYCSGKLIPNFSSKFSMLAATSCSPLFLNVKLSIFLVSFNILYHFVFYTAQHHPCEGLQPCVPIY